MREKKQLNVNIGRRIKYARESSGLTQERLAEAVDVSVQFISDLERGVVGVAVPTLVQICRTLNASCDYILFNEQESEEDDIILITRRIKRYTPKQREIAVKTLDALTEAFAVGKENEETQ